MENTTASMLDGSARLDDILSMTEGLLADVSAAGSYWSEDGMLAYDLLEDPELGKASLHVNLGRPGKPNEFQLRVRMHSGPGFLYPEDATGSDLTVNFGFDEESGNSCTALVHTEFIYDRPTNERHMGKGPLVIGGFLRVDREHSKWAPETADTQPDLEHGVKRLHTFGEELDVHAGDIASPDMEALGRKLRSLRLERR